jgi:CRP-like cAMP-binding protein
MADRSQEDVEWLVANGAEQHVSAGGELVVESESSPSVYVVLKGAFTVADGPEAVRLGAGEVAGPPSITRRAPGRVVAGTDAVVWAIPRDRLQARIDHDAGVLNRFRRVAKGLTLEWVRDIRDRSARGRNAGGGRKDDLDGMRVYELIERMLQGDLPQEDEDDERKS